MNEEQGFTGGFNPWVVALTVTLARLVVAATRYVIRGWLPPYFSALSVRFSRITHSASGSAWTVILSPMACS